MEVRKEDLYKLSSAIRRVLDQTERVGEPLATYTGKLKDVWGATEILAEQLSESESG